MICFFVTFIATLVKEVSYKTLFGIYCLWMKFTETCKWNRKIM